MTDGAANVVWQYTQGANGALVAMSTASVSAGVGPTSIAVDPAAKYAYVSNSSDNTVSLYTIGSDGSLSPMSQIGRAHV